MKKFILLGILITLCYSCSTTNIKPSLKTSEFIVTDYSSIRTNPELNKYMMTKDGQKFCIIEREGMFNVGDTLVLTRKTKKLQVLQGYHIIPLDRDSLIVQGGAIIHYKDLSHYIEKDNE